MTGSKTTSTTTAELRAARERGESKSDVAKVRTETPYVWDGKNQDDRPLTHEEMQSGIAAYRKQRGRPVGSDKESTTIRFDRAVLAAFRAAGPGWQTRMNAALREWLKTHTPA
ncbi:MAG: BrnA antitoxin family protein [Rhodocyclaceae bacterium]|nr:BrnA antitoxin family protein [Rhodocyclaceae bacterium]